MFAITEDAAAAIKGIVGAPGVPEGAGLRITQGPEDGFRAYVIPAPEEGDEVLEEERIFLAPDTARSLDDKLLDADIVDDEVRFSLDVQAETQ